MTIKDWMKTRKTARLTICDEDQKPHPIRIDCYLSKDTFEKFANLRCSMECTEVGYDHYKAEHEVLND